MPSRRRFKLPEPAGFAVLGEVHRLSYKGVNGSKPRYCWGRTRYKTDVDFRLVDKVVAPGRPPLLLWAEDVKALYIFPGFAVQGFGKGPIPERALRSLKVFNDYDRGAKASAGDVEVATPNYPEPVVAARGGAFDIVYRSEKWNGKDGERHDYQHHFSKSGAVELFQGTGAFFIQGGRLTVNDRGIVY